MNNIIIFRSDLQKGKRYIYMEDKEMSTIERNNINGLTQEKMIKIEEIVEQLLNNSKSPSISNPYVDIVPFVISSGFSINKKKLPINTTGYLLSDAKEIVVNTIFTNPNDEENMVLKKSRFTTAHEFGHYILHENSYKKNSLTYRFRDAVHKTDPIELEADYFARSILMPLFLFKSYYEVASDMFKNNPNSIIENLSKIFVVSKNKVKTRINDLAELENYFDN